LQSPLFTATIHSMKKEIHPQFFEVTTITCTCGNVIETGSTIENLHVEICSACHPFYTGQEKLIDTEGRVERFEKRIKHASKVSEVKAQKKSQIEKARIEAQMAPKSLKEMLTGGNSAALAAMAAKASKKAGVAETKPEDK